MADKTKEVDIEALYRRLYPEVKRPEPMIPQEKMAKLVESALTEEAPPERWSGPWWRQTIGRGLTGFSRGMAATPREGAYSPLLGGIAGGLRGTGEVMEAERASAEREAEPRRQLVRNIVGAQMGEEVKLPYQEYMESLKQQGRDVLMSKRLSALQSQESNKAQQLADRYGLKPSDVIKIMQEAKKELSEKMLLQKGQLVDETDPLFVDSVYRIAEDKANQIQALQGRKPRIPAVKPAPVVAPKAKPKSRLKEIFGF